MKPIRDIADVGLDEAQARMRLEARRVHEKELRPDGQVVELHVYDHRIPGLPNVQIRLKADGTWEYVE